MAGLLSVKRVVGQEVISGMVNNLKTSEMKERSQSPSLEV
jgi:hypothetical protein